MSSSSKIFTCSTQIKYRNILLLLSNFNNIHHLQKNNIQQSLYINFKQSPKKYITIPKIMSKQNPQPKLYQAYQLSANDKKQRNQLQLDAQADDKYDELQIFQLIRHINDPQYPLTLEQLNVINLQRIYLRNQNYVEIYFTPTIPHCSMAQMIGLMVRVKLFRFLPKHIKTRVMITPGTHVSQIQINKQINDKQRVAAAVENPNIGRILMRGFFNSDRFEF